MPVAGQPTSPQMHVWPLAVPLREETQVAEASLQEDFLITCHSNSGKGTGAGGGLPKNENLSFLLYRPQLASFVPVVTEGLRVAQQSAAGLGTLVPFFWCKLHTQHGTWIH